MTADDTKDVLVLAPLLLALLLFVLRKLGLEPAFILSVASKIGSKSIPILETDHGIQRRRRGRKCR
jgi:hypothetical protein